MSVRIALKPAVTFFCALVISRRRLISRHPAVQPNCKGEVLERQIWVLYEAAVSPCCEPSHSINILLIAILPAPCSGPCYRMFYSSFTGHASLKSMMLSNSYDSTRYTDQCGLHTLRYDIDKIS